MKTAKRDPIQSKANLRGKKQHTRFVTVDQFHLMMKEAEVKEKQSKRETFELIGALDHKLMNVDAKVTQVNYRIDNFKVSSIKRMDILEEKVNEINRRCLAIRDRVLGTSPPKSKEKQKYDGYVRDRKWEVRKIESKSHCSRRDESFKTAEREREKEKQREREREREKQREREREKQREREREEQREKQREERREKEREHQRDRENRRKIARESHESRESKSDIRMKRDLSCSPDISTSTINKSETGPNNDSRHEPLLITGHGGLLHLTEIELQELAKPDNCVQFIGKLLLASYPEGYFLKKENSFAIAVTSHHMDALYRIVSSKYKEIKRRGRPSQNLTKEEMSDVIRNKVNIIRKVNRHLIPFHFFLIP